ncbi:MAG: hypothetical protein KGI54_18260 [Pseudomonadota bacterium]|nr:hypothetical protein [Pseudomonadota bacterium]
MAQIGVPKRIIETPQPIFIPSTVPIEWPESVPDPMVQPAEPVRTPELVPA